jgi:OmpR family response regulator RpaB
MIQRRSDPLREGKKVLIIDDEHYIRRVIELKLKKRGYQVITATNGEEGLECFQKHQPDAVITDIRMPRLDGKTFCELTNPVKKNRPFLTIVISCSVTRDDFKWLEGMDEALFFEKPFSPSKLLDSLDRYFGFKSA